MAVRYNSGGGGGAVAQSRARGGGGGLGQKPKLSRRGSVSVRLCEKVVEGGREGCWGSVAVMVVMVRLPSREREAVGGGLG